MTGLDLIFAVVGLITAAAAIKTVTSTNLVHAALFLAVTLAGIAGVFLVLSADFLALVQLVDDDVRQRSEHLIRPGRRQPSE